MKTRLHGMSICLMGGLLLSVASFAGDEYGSKWGEDARFKTMDSNMDGKLSSAEYSAGAKKKFDKLDENKDGKVTASEMDAGYKAMMGAKDSKPSDMTHGARKMSSAEKIKAMDTNGDAMLTAEEHAAGSRSMFGKLDTDKDGSLTTAEAKAGHEKTMTAHDE